MTLSVAVISVAVISVGGIFVPESEVIVLGPAWLLSVTGHVVCSIVCS